MAFMNSEAQAEDEVVTLRRSDLERIMALLSRLENRDAAT